MDYRRVWQPGGCYFFTVVTYQRQASLIQKEYIHYLREAFHHVRKKRPFDIDAIVVLPDHIHCIWTLPNNDADYATRWRLIKHFVTCKIYKNNTNKNRVKIWQKRYWEHCLRDENDRQKHMDYIHFNPVKHGYVSSPLEWPYSSFGRAVEMGQYDKNWGQNIKDEIIQMDFE
jgi:putative transposase